jgi:hypothetical protein
MCEPMTSELVIIFLPVALLAGMLYCFWRAGGPRLQKNAPDYDAAETPSLAVYRRFERPWRWGLLICNLGVTLWVTASLLGLVPFTAFECVALATPFVSMSFFGLYTGEVTFRESTVRREKNPIQFWAYLSLDTLMAGFILYLVATGSVRY